MPAVLNPIRKSGTWPLRQVRVIAEPAAKADHIRQSCCQPGNTTPALTCGRRDMADDKVPSRVPWPDDIKRKGELTIGLDASIGKAVWDRVFRDAIFEFNKLSNTHKLGVTFVRAEDATKANVEARAATGDFEFASPPDIPKETVRFDGKGLHGFCRPVPNRFIDRSRVRQYT